MEKFIIDNCFNSDIKKDVIDKTKTSLRKVVNSYLPKKDERVISTSIGYNK